MNPNFHMRVRDIYFYMAEEFDVIKYYRRISNYIAVQFV